MKASTIAFFFFYISLSATFGQTTFQKSLDVQMDTSFIRCVPDGSAVFLVGQIKKIGQLRLRILKINGNGTLLWQKEYLAADKYDVKGMVVQADGVVALMSAEKEAFLLKLNTTDGSFAWHKWIGQGESLQIYDVNSDDKDNIWLSGLHFKATPADSNYYFQIKTDKNGLPTLAKKNKFSTVNIAEDIRFFKPTNLTWQASIGRMIAVEDLTAPFTKAPYFVFNHGRKQLALADANMGYIEQDLETNFIELASANKFIAFSASYFSDSTKLLFGLMDENASRYTVLRASDGLMRPIHNNNDGSIVFYSEKYKTLTKYDVLLNPIWTKKYDNCINTYGFNADIAKDGSLFTVRNLAGNTLISRINADGSQKQCVDYNVKAVKDSNYTKVPSVMYNVDAPNYTFPIFKDSIVSLADISANILPYCLKIDASFTIPDTVCISNVIKPTDIDSNVLLKHTWVFNGTTTEIPNPTIRYIDLGAHNIFHQINLNGCIDTANHSAFMIPTPIIKMNDTVVCGQKDLTIDLTAKYGKFYYQNGQLIKPIVKIDSSGTYHFTVATKNCAVDNTVKITINNFPLPHFQQDSVICNGNPYPVVFDNIFTNIFWDRKPVKDTFFVKDGYAHPYVVTYKADTACVIRGSVAVGRRNCNELFVPNAFSPNDDTFNDVFQPYPLPNHKIMLFSIFDRWGNKVFESKDAPFSWDGKLHGQFYTAGVYIYVIKYFDTTLQREVINTGDVTLMR